MVILMTRMFFFLSVLTASLFELIPILAFQYYANAKRQFNIPYVALYYGDASDSSTILRGWKIN